MLLTQISESPDITCVKSHNLHENMKVWVPGEIFSLYNIYLYDFHWTLKIIHHNFGGNNTHCYYLGSLDYSCSKNKLVYRVVGHWAQLLGEMEHMEIHHDEP